MTAIRLIQKPVNGQIVIDVPEVVQALTLEIDVPPIAGAGDGIRLICQGADLTG